jgi:hypothetical protein
MDLLLPASQPTLHANAVRHGTPTDSPWLSEMLELDLANPGRLSGPDATSTEARYPATGLDSGHHTGRGSLGRTPPRSSGQLAVSEDFGPQLQAAGVVHV